MAGVFWPRMFVATSIINNARLAAMTGGGTVIANAAENAAAAALAWVPACSACAAVLISQDTCDAAGAAIDAHAGPGGGPATGRRGGPNPGPPVSWEIVDP